MTKIVHYNYLLKFLTFEMEDVIFWFIFKEFKISWKTKIGNISNEMLKSVSMIQKIHFISWTWNTRKFLKFSYFYHLYFNFWNKTIFQGLQICGTYRISPQINFTIKHDQKLLFQKFMKKANNNSINTIKRKENAANKRNLLHLKNINDFYEQKIAKGSITVKLAKKYYLLSLCKLTSKIVHISFYNVLNFWAFQLW